MKYVLFFLVVVLFSCKKSDNNRSTHDYRCLTEVVYDYRPSDHALYLSHGSWTSVTTNRFDTLYGYDTTSIMNYMHSHSLNVPVLAEAIGDTVVYVDSGTDCQHYTHY